MKNRNSKKGVCRFGYVIIVCCEQYQSLAGALSCAVAVRLSLEPRNITSRTQSAWKTKSRQSLYNVT